VLMRCHIISFCQANLLINA